MNEYGTTEEIPQTFLIPPIAEFPLELEELLSDEDVDG